MSGPAHPNLKYARQVDAGPPTFVLLCTRAAKSSAAYMAFVTNSLRKTFRLHGVPLRVYLRDANVVDRRDRRDVPERRGGGRGKQREENAQEFTAWRTKEGVWRRRGKANNSVS